MTLFFIKLLLGIFLLSAFTTGVGALTLLGIVFKIFILGSEVPDAITNTVGDVTIISFVVFLIMLAVNDMSE